MPNEIGTCALYYDPEDAARDDGFGWNAVDPHGVVAERFKDPYDAVAALRNEVDDGTTPWKDDLTQFARLLCEIQATQPDLDFQELGASMGLGDKELSELFDRAHARWETAKLRAFNFNKAGVTSGRMKP